MKSDQSMVSLISNQMDGQHLNCHSSVVVLLFPTHKATRIRTTKRTVVAGRKVVGQEALERTIGTCRGLVIQRRWVDDICQTCTNRTTEIAHGTINVDATTVTATTIQTRWSTKKRSGISLSGWRCLLGRTIRTTRKWSTGTTANATVILVMRQIDSWRCGQPSVGDVVVHVLAATARREEERGWRKQRISAEFLNGLFCWATIWGGDTGPSSGRRVSGQVHLNHS